MFKVLSAADKPRNIYLGDNRDHSNQGHVFSFVLHFEVTPFSNGQLSKVSARLTVFNWEIYEGIGPRTIHSSSQSSGTELQALLYNAPKKQRLINSTVSIGPLTRNQALTTHAWKKNKQNKTI